jgi:hypothetical protein
MRPTRKASLALATIVAGLAGVSAIDSASAQSGGWHGHGTADTYGFRRAPVPGQRVSRSDGLSAVVSDAPEGLRAKRRDVEAHSLSPLTRQGRNPAAVGAPVMRGMGAPAMRGVGGMRGRR